MARFCTVLSISSNLLKYNIRSSFITLITLRAHCHQALKHIALMGQRGMRRTNYSPLYHFLPLYHSKHTAQLRNRISMESSKKKCHMSKVHASNFCIALSFLMRINLTKPPFLMIFQSIHTMSPKKTTHMRAYPETFLPPRLTDFLWIFHSRSCGFEDRLWYC